MFLRTVTQPISAVVADACGYLLKTCVATKQCSYPNCTEVSERRFQNDAPLLYGDYFHFCWLDRRSDACKCHVLIYFA